MLLQRFASLTSCCLLPVSLVIRLALCVHFRCFGVAAFMYVHCRQVPVGAFPAATATAPLQCSLLFPACLTVYTEY